MRLVPRGWVTHDTYDQTMVEVELWPGLDTGGWLARLCTLSHTQQAAPSPACPHSGSLSRPAPRHSLLSLDSLSTRSQSTDCREREQSGDQSETGVICSDQGPGQRECQPQSAGPGN